MNDSQRQRRVLIIVENLPSPFDRRVWHEATTLTAAGYGVAIICPTGKGYEARHEVIDGIDIYRHPLPEAKHWWEYPVEYLLALFWESFLTLRVLRRHGFDVIHACNPPDTIFLIGAVARLFGKCFVFDHHDANPELYLAKFGRKDWRYKLLVWLERCTFNFADVVISTNESYRKIALARGAVPCDRVFVVRSGPSLERMRVEPPNPERRHGREFLVGYVGVMGEQEGIHFLLEAICHIVDVLGRHDIHFTLVGGGSALEDMRALSRQMGTDAYVTFEGRVSDDVLLEVLNTADVCVNPDTHNVMNDISTMNKIMEYMALGKPIVQFDLTEGRVSAGDASLYAAPNDAKDLAAKIVWLIDNPEARRRMGVIGQRRIHEQLEWRYEAPKLLNAYDCAFDAAAR